MQCYADLRLKLGLGSVQTFAISIYLEQHSKHVIISRFQHVCVLSTRFSLSNFEAGEFD